MDRNLIVKFEIFGKELGIYWYGVMIALGILACFVVLFLFAKYKKVDEKFTDFCFYNAIFAIAAGLGGAALLQAIYNYIQNPEAGFNFGEGLTFIGGLIGGVGFFLIVYFIVRRKFNDTLLKVMPIVGSCVTVAHGFGRIGCFIAGCCYGKPTCSDYGCYFDTLERVHPTQLYEAIFLFVLFAVLTFLAFKYEFQYNMGIYLIAYGIFRFVNEFFRGDDRGQFVKGVSPSQFWSIIMVLLGIGYILAIKFDLFGKCARALDIAKHNRDIKNGKSVPDANEKDASSENE
ncbi:MAG: prolipoprotein diacylglyceryl transferase [Clostridia bacterium]|nr:prolipoprotein diacylglyceryl transferase [Clostridia bacterium]